MRADRVRHGARRGVSGGPGRIALAGSLLFLLLVLWLSPPLEAAEPSLSCTVTRVIDGDTLVARCPELGEIRVRLIGTDTPETKHPNRPVEPFGKEASAFTTRVALGQSVRLDLDTLNLARKHRCRYGRVLAYVFVRQVDGVLFDLNAQIISQGYGYVYTRFPFTRMEEFRRLEQEARKARRGLWKATDSPADPAPVPDAQTRPDAPKAPEPQQAQKPPRKESRCLIKGNINSRGQRLYHLPGTPFYERTRIDEARGQRWFCTEEEALEAGWLKAGRR